MALSCGLFAGISQGEERVPSGWTVSKTGWPGRGTIDCYNIVSFPWHVSFDTELRIRAMVNRTQRRDAFPFAVPPAVADADRFGDRHVLRTDDGWLVGWDAGEFGGGLWWFSPDGARSYKIAIPRLQAFVENVLSLWRSDRGVVVFIGLRHMMIDEGGVFRAARVPGGSWQLTLLHDLGDRPGPITPQSDGATAFLLSTGIWRLAADEAVTRLTAPLREVRWPTSIATAPDGTIYVGMESLVTRMTLTPSGSREDWLAPKDCPTVRGMGFPCHCAP